MNITIRKDTLLVGLNTIELADVGSANGMIHHIHRNIRGDLDKANQQGKRIFLERRAPISYYSHWYGQVHVVRILLGFWSYFKDAHPTSVWEQQIREEIIVLGLSGKADELAQQYSN